jgi:hypothetical protein
MHPITKNKGGFKLLETRKVFDNVDSKLIEFEKTTGLKLPNLYKVFSTTFILGFNSIAIETFKYQDFYLPCSGYIYSPKEYIGFEHFIDLEMIGNIWNDFDEDSYEKRNYMIPIGATGTSAIIFVCANLGNEDKIYFEKEGEWTFLCNNIFEFVRGVEYWTSETGQSNSVDVKFSHLYKNWDEDFWRVKKDA